MSSQLSNPRQPNCRRSRSQPTQSSHSHLPFGRVQHNANLYRRVDTEYMSGPGGGGQFGGGQRQHMYQSTKKSGTDARSAGPGNTSERYGSGSTGFLPSESAAGGTAWGKMSGTGESAEGRVLPSQVEFLTPDVYGSINCLLPLRAQEQLRQQKEREQAAAAPMPAGTGTRSRKKPGPILLEVRRLVPETDPVLRRLGACFASQTIAVSRGNPSLGGGVASTCLSFRPDLGNQNPGLGVTRVEMRRLSLSSKTTAAADGAIVQCATGLTNGTLCVHTFANLDEDTAVDNAEGIEPSQDFNPFDESFVAAKTTVAYYAPRNHRPATSVAWRPGPTPSELRHVAVGLGSSGGSDRGGTAHAAGTYHRGRVGASGASVIGGGGPAGFGGGVGGGGGDREFSCLVWDIEAQRQGTTVKGTGQVPVKLPVYRFAHNTSVSSLSWLSRGDLLAVGTQNRGAVQLYDLRVSGTNAPPISIYAHSEAIAGIERDPFRPNVFATFGRGVMEPVQLWDARMMDGSIGEIKVGDGEAVSTVAWSEHLPGTITVVTGDAFRTYDTTVSGSRSRLTGIRYSPVNVRHLKYQPQGAGSDGATSAKDRPFDLYPFRMLAVQGDGAVQDLASHQVAPINISNCDGRTAFSMGRTVWFDSDTTTFMDRSTKNARDDISALIIKRARYLHSSRYAMDAKSHLDLLEKETRDELSNSAGGMDVSRREDLTRLWRWVERVESLCAERDDTGGTDELPPWPAKGLIDAGVYRLLRLNTEESNDYLLDTVTKSEALGCNLYDSPLRSAALNACGWTGKFGLRDCLSDCESKGNFERSAALAVWHGDLGAAVSALQRGADGIRLNLTEDKERGKPYEQTGLASAQYAETLQLVAMCISGFRATGNELGVSSTVWHQSCEGLLQQRQDLLNEKKKSGSVSYLRAACFFLLSLGRADGFDKVLEDDTLSLSDRVAFACMFLARNDLKHYLGSCISNCEETGTLEGILITGLDRRGIRLLQCYVDAYSDVQTAALVSSRVLLPADWLKEIGMCSEWLDAYRDLLNTLSMWLCRAMFDVGRADLLRTLKERQADDLVLPTTPATRVAPQGRRGYMTASQGRTRQTGSGVPNIKPETGTEIIAHHPPQLFARCNYCNTPLPLSRLRRQEGIANSWLSRQNPILSCCPQCRKPLPRCAICLLPMGCLNPYMELKRERNRVSRVGQNQVGMDDLSDLSNIPFAEWFTWCMRCKHGGHAHHLVGWFAKHDTCPVSGCDCQCQFDGVKNLPRN